MKDDHSEGLARGVVGIMFFVIVVVIVVACIVISKLIDLGTIGEIAAMAFGWL